MVVREEGGRREKQGKQGYFKDETLQPCVLQCVKHCGIRDSQLLGVADFKAVPSTAPLPFAT